MIAALFPGTNLSELRSRLRRMPRHLALLGVFHRTRPAATATTTSPDKG
jgi:hypothetical protein